MPTVNFSVPADVRDAFNAVFKGQNKSAIIAALMREAVEHVETRRRSVAACKRIAERRAQAPVATAQQVRTAREQGHS